MGDCSKEHTQEEQKQLPTSNIISLVGFILSFFIPIAGIVLGIIGIFQEKKKYSKYGFKFALAAIIIGFVTMIIGVILVLTTGKFFH